jgi:[acyl-carrier-protein] S-malonyltransferase
MCFVFPGQGSQTVGMGLDFANDPEIKELFERADEALSFGLSKLMWAGDAAELTQTQNAQPALLVCGLAALAYLGKQSGKDLSELTGYVAGHSLGEYTAVAAAGGMGLEAAVQCVRLRGEAMMRSGAEGSMSAILGLEPEVADKVAAEHGVVFANDNAAGQAIFSGPVDALAKAEEAAKAAGAKRALRLNVSGPFHTPGMAPAAGEVRDFLASNPLKQLVVPCMMNASAELRSEADAVAEGLVAQVTSRVRWCEGMIQLADLGVTDVVEFGVGKVLGGLASRCDGRLNGASLSSRADVDAWLEARN